MRISSYHSASYAAQSVAHYLFASEELPDFSIGKKHILLVEDNPLLQHIHSAWLEQLGYEVMVVGSGEAALSEVLSDYDAVLMDIDLPGIDGVTTTQQLFRQNPKLKIPVIACSTHSSAEMKKSCISAGMSDYLQKPISPEILKKSLTTHLS